ncbi:methylthioribulose 1-phosphate dehydratase [Acidobacteria bacterium AB60]|nr:methylthioribulose 1-phosphate dehydratase [Acidobacteria bacterium AB60]
MVPDARALTVQTDALCALARWCAGRGWVPATSGNFSVKDAATERIFISRSGLDKGQITPADLLELDVTGNLLHGDGRPSAETGLHLVIYRDRPKVHAIAHVHTIWNTLLSARCAAAGAVEMEGYELLKALSGVTTHAYRECVPVIANTQDYAALAQELTGVLKQNPAVHGVLLSGHGLYTWGTSVAEARRHLEALEFLFEVEGRRITSEG